MDLLGSIRNYDIRRPILRGGTFPYDDRGEYQQNGTSDAEYHEIMLVGKGCRVRLREDPNPDIFEFDGGSLGFQAEIALGRIRILAARNLNSIDPEPDFTINRPNVVMVPRGARETVV